MPFEVSLRTMDNVTEFDYRCENDAGWYCAETCKTLQECYACPCAIIPVDGGGPWGDVMDVIFCFLPILFLLIVTIKPNPLPTTQSLPISAAMMYLVRLMYLGSDPVLTNAAVILGIFEAFTPLSIMAGAITLFESMEATKCLPYMMREMKALTAGHPIAELMLIFAFAYMVEGASGFGTPVALGAPMLVSTGHSELESVVVLLIMNTFATVWGAVGTPIWFGYGDIATEAEFLEVSYKAAVALTVSSVFLLPLCLGFIVPFVVIRQNWLFIYLSLATVVIPSLIISFVSFEFPALIGGMIGCAGTAILIKYKVGLHDVPSEFVISNERNPENDFLSETEISTEKNTMKPLSNDNEIVSTKDRGIVRDEETGQDSTIENILPVRDNIDDSYGTSEKSEGSDEKTEERDEPSTEEDVISDNKTKNNQTTTIVDDEETCMDRDTSRKEGISSMKNGEPSKVSSSEIQSKVDEDDDDGLGPRKSFGEGYVTELILRTFPIWAVVLLLVLTRVEQIGIKEHLIGKDSGFTIIFGTFGTFRISTSIVLQLSNIMTYPGLNWKYEVLYIPFLVPFCLVSVLSMVIFRKDLERRPGEIVTTVMNRLSGPAIALLGALVLVQLLIKVDSLAPAFILGTVLAEWFREAFIVISPLLGALGSFFSGSTTVSNLTFGQIQAIAAESIGTSKTTMLALQAVGASAGNGICLNNIIAACAVVGLKVGEGKILMKTYKFVLTNTTIATVVMLIFFFRF